MRIGIDCRYLREAPRGVGHYLTNVLIQLTKMQTDDNFYLYSPGPILYKPQRDNFVIRQGHISLPGTFWFQTEGKSFILADKLDAFWAPCDILPSGLPKTIFKVLSVLDLTHLYFPQTMANYNLLIHNLFFLSSLKNSNHIITISNFIKKDLIEHFHIPSEKITTVYLGVDDKFHMIEKEEVLSALNQFSITRPYILSVGTIEPKKNYIRLLQAYKALKTDLDLVIVGQKGWKANDIFKTIDKLGLKERVKILGYVQIDDLPYLYNGAEVFVFPSLYEGFGLPLIEAMACGVPVICSNTSSLDEIGGDAALKFNPESIDELVSQIENLINNQTLKETLRNKGRERAKQFTWDKTAQQTLAVLKGK